MPLCIVKTFLKMLLIMKECKGVTEQLHALP
jgi:hypothetical protein